MPDLINSSLEGGKNILISCFVVSASTIFSGFFLQKNRKLLAISSAVFNLYFCEKKVSLPEDSAEGPPKPKFNSKFYCYM